MKTFKKSELSVLRSRISDLTEQGRKAWRRIRASRGLDRWLAWEEKRSIGEEARTCFLSYAFLRGVPYRVVEPTASFNGMPEDVWRKLLTRRIIGALRGYAPDTVDPTLWPEQVLAWVSVPEDPARAARREAARQQWAVRREEIRARYEAQRQGAA